MPNPGESQVDAALERVLAEYLQSIDAGRPQDRAAILAAHPELADELQSFFRNRDAVARMSEPYQRAAAAIETIGVEAAAVDGAPRIRYFGDYELLAEIARGGMGIVYRARQVSLNRTVAVKLILAGQFASPADVQRFRTEAEAAANLDHPHIVPIYEIGEHEGSHYFSMKLVEGGNFSSLAQREGPLRKASFKNAVATLSKVARAVHFAHQRGILHRDLKPANILLDSQGEPMVSDFGLAKRVEADSHLTQTGAIVGTPSYMAPEQARGDKDISTAADVYSLGAMLYELLAGRPPFKGQTPMDTLIEVMQREPERPSRVTGNVDRDLETIAMKCLEKVPERRYSSAEALADDLDRWLRGEPILARPAGRGERAWRWCRRNPAIAAISAALVVALVAGTVVSSSFAVVARHRADREAAAAQREKNEAERRAAAEAAALAALRNEQSTSYANRIVLALNEWQANHAPAAKRLLDQCPAELRGWEWRYVDRLARPELLDLDGANGVPGTVAFSADGKLVVAWGFGAILNEQRRQGTYVWNADTGKLLQVLDTEYLDWASFSADGRLLATGDGRFGDGTRGAVNIWDTATWKAVCTITVASDFPQRDLKDMVFSPDGKRLYLCGNDDHDNDTWIVCHSVPDGKKLATFQGEGPLAVSPDGARLFATRRGKPRICDAATGKVMVECRGKGLNGGLGQAAFSPDGQRVAAAGHQADNFSRGTLIVWDARTGADVYRKEFDRPAEAMAYSRDGRLLAVAIQEDVKVFKAETGEELFTMHTGANLLSAVAFHPDGKRLATATGLYGRKNFDTHAKIWRVAPQGPISIEHHIAYWEGVGTMTGTPSGLPENPWEPDNLVFAADGEHFAFIAERGRTARLFRLATGEEERTWKLPADRPDDYFHRLAFAADGHLLAVVITAAKLKESDAARVARADLQAKGVAKGTGAAPTRPSQAQGRATDHKSPAEKTFALELRDLTADNKPPLVLEPRVQGVPVDNPFNVSLRFSADGRRLVIGDGEDVEVWDVAEERILCTLSGAYKGGGIIHLSADGSRVAVARNAVFNGVGTMGANLYDFATGKLIRGGLRSYIGLSSDGRRLAELGEGRVILYDAITGEELPSLQDTGGIVGFSRDSRILATNKKVWDVASGTEICRFAETTSMEGAFSPDGRRLATVGNDREANEIDLWDTQTGQRTFTLRGLPSRVTRIHFSGDGNRVITVDESTIKIWDATR